ncbi:MAG: DUF6884 domain-containing protein [Blastocatellales bacterium]
MSQDDSPRRLLVISCSRKKKTISGLLPALERYDGPTFQVVRKYIASCPAEARKLDIHILSARFGLIPSNKPVICYDTRMTRQAAGIMNRQALSTLRKVLLRRDYKQLFVTVGRDYLAALDGYEAVIPKEVELTVAAGSSGRRQAELHDWLYGEPPLEPAVSLTGTVSIRGVTICLTPKEIVDIALKALAKGQGDHNRYQSWFVRINRHQVAPKWLVSRLTGLPVSNFHSDEARRVLQQLGVKVFRSERPNNGLGG